jgi:hypothetical protein
MQTAFASATRGIDQAPQGLTSHNGSSPEQRFAVYRNNVAVALIGALETRFPVVAQLVGADFFKHMAREFIAKHPPTSPVMVEYGEAFSSFISSFEPVQHLAYLPGVAQLEFMQSIVFYAADTPATGAAAFAQIPPERLADAKLTLAPSVHLLRATHAAYSIWAAHHGQGTLASIEPNTPENVLIYRGDETVELLPCSDEAADVIDAMARGDVLSVIAAQQSDASVLQSVLAMLLQHNLISNVEVT